MNHNFINSYHNKIYISQLLKSFVLFTVLFISANIHAQILIKGKVYFDEDGREVPTVKVLKDNLPYQQFKTSASGKFNAKLPIGHDYMFEISKPYNYTTRLAVSTKFPDNISTDNLYESFKLETDLLPHYNGLDASIMTFPVMILRFKEEEQAFVNDTVYLETVREKLEKLLFQIEKLEKKGATKVNSEFTSQEMKRIDLTELLLMSNDDIEDEIESLNEEDEEVDSKSKTPKKEEKKEDIKKQDTAKIKNPSFLSVNDEKNKKKNKQPIESSSAVADNSTKVNVETETDQMNDSDTITEESVMADTTNQIALNETENPITSDEISKDENNSGQNSSEVMTPKTSVNGDQSFYSQWWFYLLVVGFGAFLWWIILGKKRSNRSDK